MIEAQTAFLVVIDTDGVINTYTEEFPEVSIQRTASLFDIEAYCSQVARSVDRTILAKTLLALGDRKEPSVSDIVSHALGKRQSEQVTGE